MTREEFDAFCGAMTATSHVVQWGGASVWKVGGKVFAIYSNWGGEDDAVVLKPTEMAREIWRGAAGVRLAPYLGRAGWIQIRLDAMSPDELRDMIVASHHLIAAGISKTKRRALGLPVD